MDGSKKSLLSGNGVSFLEGASCEEKILHAAGKYIEACELQTLRSPPTLWRVLRLCCIPVVVVIPVCYIVIASPLDVNTQAFLRHLSAGSLSVSFAREAFSRARTSNVGEVVATLTGAGCSMALFSWAVHTEGALQILPFAFVYVVDGALIATVMHTNSNRIRDILLACTVAFGGAMDAVGQIQDIHVRMPHGWQFMPVVFGACILAGGWGGMLVRWIGNVYLMSFTSAFLNLSMLAASVELAAPTEGAFLGMDEGGINLPFAIGFVVMWFMIIMGEWFEDRNETI